jgi:excisionase family DNA binding protein
VFYTLDEVAEIFQCSSRTVRRMVERDELHTVHIGRTPMVPAGEIDRIAQRAS